VKGANPEFIGKAKVDPGAAEIAETFKYLQAHNYVGSDWSDRIALANTLLDVDRACCRPGHDRTLRWKQLKPRWRVDIAGSREGLSTLPWW
jgi:hypothetical protein